LFLKKNKNDDKEEEDHVLITNLKRNRSARFDVVPLSKLKQFSSDDQINHKRKKEKSEEQLKDALELAQSLVDIKTPDQRQRKALEADSIILHTDIRSRAHPVPTLPLFGRLCLYPDSTQNTSIMRVSAEIFGDQIMLDDPFKLHDDRQNGFNPKNATRIRVSIQDARRYVLDFERHEDEYTDAIEQLFCVPKKPQVPEKLLPQLEINCPICQESLDSDPNNVIKLSPCQHRYHQTCLHRKVNYYEKYHEQKSSEHQVKRTRHATHLQCCLCRAQAKIIEK